MSDTSSAASLAADKSTIAAAVANAQAYTGLPVKVSSLYTAGTAAGSGMIGTIVVMLLNMYLPQPLPADDATLVVGVVTTIAVWIMHAVGKSKLAF